MTEDVSQVLKGGLCGDREKKAFADRVARLAADLANHAGPHRKTIGKEEIDAMWGHSPRSSIDR